MGKPVVAGPAGQAGHRRGGVDRRLDRAEQPVHALVGIPCDLGEELIGRPERGGGGLPVIVPDDSRGQRGDDDHEDRCDADMKAYATRPQSPFDRHPSSRRRGDRAV